MCDDLRPDEFPDGHDEECPEREAFFEELHRELFGDIPPDEERSEDAPPTPGERVLYALGQLRRLHLAGRLAVSPTAFSVEDVARIVGVAGDLEFVTEDRYGQHCHFPTEILSVNPAKPFPWRLLGAWEWAAEREDDDSWEDGLG